MVRLHARPIVSIGVTVVQRDFHARRWVTLRQAAVPLSRLPRGVDHEEGDLAGARVREETHLECSTPRTRERVA
ncbi:MAG: hypothetical protein P4L99_21180, partial [Chthoniobacter sp.]|nr:hypothetical protein [Chthoniobacter sp.]